MTWTKLDDAAPQHPKAKLAGNDAWGLWAAAIVYSNRFLTDGVVSVGVLATECLPEPMPLARAKKLAEKLCDAKTKPDGHGLFERLDGGFYRIHDFEDYNPTKAEIEAKRQVDRERKKGGRGGGGSGGSPSGIPNGSPSGNPNGTPSGIRAESERNPSGVPARDAPAGARPPVPSQPVPSQPSPLALRAKMWLEDPNRASFQHPNPERWPEVVALQQRLSEVFGLPIEQPRTPKDPRCRLALERYAEGYTPETLLRAILGAKQSRAIADSREYQTLATILRDAAQVDKLAALARPSSVARVRETEAQRLAREAVEEDARRVARGLPPLNDPTRQPVSDPAEIDRLVGSIG